MRLLINTFITYIRTYVHTYIISLRIFFHLWCVIFQWRERARNRERRGGNASYKIAQSKRNHILYTTCMHNGTCYTCCIKYKFGSYFTAAENSTKYECECVRLLGVWNYLQIVIYSKLFARICWKYFDDYCTRSMRFHVDLNKHPQLISIIALCIQYNFRPENVMKFSPMTKP